MKTYTNFEIFAIAVSMFVSGFAAAILFNAILSYIFVMF